MQRNRCRQASLPLPELVLTLLPPIWSHGRCFGGGPEQNRPKCRAELGEFAARFGLAAWLLRTHERDGRALPGCARDRNRRRTRPVGNRIRVSVRVVQDGEVVDVADTQVPTCGRQAGPHLVAWAPAHPRPFVAPRSCRTVVRICLGRACDQAETGYRDATRYQGTGDDERQAVRDVHAVRFGLLSGIRLRPTTCKNSRVRTASDRADHRSSWAPHTYTVTRSCWPHHCTGRRKSTSLQSVSSIRCI